MTSSAADNFTINGPLDGPHVVLLGTSIVCRNCVLDGCSVHAGPSSAFRHMLRHTESGHRVRRGVLDGLAVASAILTARDGEASP